MYFGTFCATQTRMIRLVEITKVFSSGTTAIFQKCENLKYMNILKNVKTLKKFLCLRRM